MKGAIIIILSEGSKTVLIEKTCMVGWMWRIKMEGGMNGFEYTFFKWGDWEIMIHISICNTGQILLTSHL